MDSWCAFGFCHSPVNRHACSICVHMWAYVGVLANMRECVRMSTKVKIDREELVDLFQKAQFL